MNPLSTKGILLGLLLLLFAAGSTTLVFSLRSHNAKTREAEANTTYPQP